LGQHHSAGYAVGCFNDCGEDKMNKIKAYFTRQASRPNMDLATDFFIVGALFVCVYFGWIH